jgi:hypothetical protein
MSRQIALDTINLKPTPRLAHTEYVSHDTLLRKVSGREELDDETWRIFMDDWEFDFIWTIDDGPVPWGERGRVTDMGHAVYTEDARDMSENLECPFESPEEVLEFNAVKEYGLPDFGELVKYYQETWEKKQDFNPNQLVTGGYYKTLISGATESFGWDMELMAAADQERFAKVLESFAELTMHHNKAWAETDIEVFIQHDDMVWTDGPFMSPDFYRKVIFPIYKKLWEPLHKAGKKVLYCCDGTFDMFIDDIIEAGADGFIFEPSNNFDLFVEKCGKTHCLVGSKVDCRTMAFDGWEAVKKQMDETFALKDKMNGHMWAVGNHIPFNVPVEIAEQYIDYLKANWAK